MKYFLWIAALFGAAISSWSQSLDTLVSEELNEVVLFDKSKGPVTQQSSVEEVLTVYKGVTLINRGQYGKDLMFKGLSADRLNVTIGGMRVFGACTDRMDPVTSYVETGNLSAVESNNGGGGGINGINLRLALPEVGQPFKARASYYGNLGLNGFGYSLNASGSYKNQSFLVQFSQRDHQDYSMPDGERLPFTGYSKTNIRMVYGLKLKEWSIALDGIADKATNIGYAGLPMDVSLAEASMVSLAAKRKFSNDGWIETKLYANSVFHLMDDSQREVVVHMDMPGWSTTYGGFVEGGKKFGDWQGSVKAEVFQNFRRAEMTMYFDLQSPMFMLTWPDTKWTSSVLSARIIKDNDLFTQSFGGNIGWQSTVVIDDFGADQWSVFGYDDLNRVNLNFSGDYSLGYSHGKSTYNMSLQFSTRAPGVSERYGFYLYNAHDGFDYLGNPDLKNESVMQGSLQHTFRSNGWEVSHSAFGNFYYDYIFGEFTAYSAMTLGAKGVRQYQNMGQAQQIGLNSTLLKKFKNGLSIKNILDFQWSKLNDQNPIPLTLPWRNRTVISYSLANYQISVTQLLTANKARVNQALSEAVTEGYQTTGISFKAKFKVKKVTLESSVGVANLFNMNYVDPLDWRPIIHPGRNYFLEFTLSL